MTHNLRDVIASERERCLKLNLEGGLPMVEVAASLRLCKKHAVSAARSKKRWGTHHRLNHGTAFAYRGKNHINGIEGFWSYAKHILYNYRGISKYHFPMYLKEVEYRYFGYVSH